MQSNRYHDDINCCFDAYCKKVIKNEAKDIWKSKKNRHKYFTFFSEISSFELEKVLSGESFNEQSNSFVVFGFEIDVKNDFLATAIEQLTQKQKEIVLLYYFVGFIDKEISGILDLPRSTIQNNRVKALEYLKTNIQRETENEVENIIR